MGPLPRRPSRPERNTLADLAECRQRSLPAEGNRAQRLNSMPRFRPWMYTFCRLPSRLRVMPMLGTV